MNDSSSAMPKTNPLELSPISCLVALSPEAEKTAKKTLVSLGINPVTSGSMCNGEVS